MTKQQSRFSKLRQHLRVKYRFVVLNDETFEEQSSLRLNRFNIYALSLSGFVLMMVLSFVLVINTPLKYLIPGFYENEITRTHILQLEAKTDSLQSTVLHRNLWMQKLKNVLMGETDSLYDAFAGYNDAFQVDSLEAENNPAAAMLASNQGNENPAAIGIEPVAAKEKMNSRTLHFISPVEGYVTAEFNRREEHYGIDLGAKENAPIKSVMEGTVISADWTIKTGHVIAIQHPNNLVSFYKHNSKLLKTAGDRVTAGEVIAIMGSSGELTTGPHLHFELWENGEPIDPKLYINF